jgi:hypothetical protein
MKVLYKGTINGTVGYAWGSNQVLTGIKEAAEAGLDLPTPNKIQQQAYEREGGNFPRLVWMKFPDDSWALDDLTKFKSNVPLDLIINHPK